VRPSASRHIGASAATARRSARPRDFAGTSRDYEPDDPDDGEISEMDIERRLATPCPECGQVGACAYDADGRALIHVTESED
jgi:hypothetical protein